ncbi:C-X-C chemokine receptor type 3-like [Lates japonicus]|uniref:C-X-C chemokine receptor type 3-like protein n=1 Tax=Lates japonicus TaxID=270547 RepID=A0AAD3N5T7_LATJO|nr:C-X-C chemokine receptor type 3-like protein [Lates japonicus]
MDVDVGGFLGQNTTYDYGDYEYKEDPESKGSEAVLIPVLYSVVLVVGLLGNVLLLVVLAQKRRSWSISDIFISHLGVADILLLLTLPFWAVQAAHHSGWSCGGFLCKFSGAVFDINLYVGIFLLVCICLVHCLSIVHTTRLCFLKTPAFAHISCALVWVISLLLTIPDWIFLEAWKDEAKGRTLCAHIYSGSQLLSRLPHHILGFLLPVAILIICCSCMLISLQSKSKSPQKQRAITVILLMVVVFFLLWMPYNITLIVDTFRSHSKETQGGSSGNPSEGSLKAALIGTSALACVHACLRPLLYLGLCGNFRKRTLAALRCTTVESKSSLWELGVGEEALPDQSHEREELKQMTNVETQVPSA